MTDDEITEPDDSRNENTDRQNQARTTPQGRSSDSETPLDAIAEQVVEVETTDPDSPLNPGRELDTLFGDARVVALGESTHGTREFFRMKHRLLRYLIERHGLRVIGLEATLPETLAVNEYVVDGHGDPRDALDDIYLWTWNVESILALIEYLREFNSDRPRADRVRFHGFDAQYTAGAIERLRRYLSDAGVDIPSDIETDLQCVDDSGEVPEQRDEREGYDDTADRLVAGLDDLLKERKPTLLAAGGERSWDLAVRLVRVIDQATTYREARANIEEDDDEALRRALAVRDESMADNVEWLREHENADQIALWAHDAHINRSKHPLRDREIATKSMGSYLDERFGDAYVAVGFAFGTGTFQALSEAGTDRDGESRYELQGQALRSPVSGTVDETLSAVAVDVGLLNVRQASRDDRLSSWVNQTQATFSAGATYDPGSPEEYVNEYTLGDAFDVLCYVDETTRARPVGADLPDT